MPIPWNDQAVISCDGGTQRTIVASGSLREVVAWLSQRQPIEWKGYLIALPDRGAPPFRYEADYISGLVNELRLDRARQRQNA